jgi:hypothetical protein
MFFLNPCSKSGARSNSDNYLEITLNGNTYTNKLTDGFGNDDQTGKRSNKVYNSENINQIETSSFSFEVDLFHFQNDIDFKKSVPRTYSSGNAN